ncbi:MAG TPA: hypothetical protein VD970_12575 [Acetobacteraceae bacterium]|nr:hypothetical protein [Acetobacteraceae bacterium]
MRRLIALLLLLGLGFGAFVLAPHAWEGTTSPCAALETRFARLASSGRAPRDLPPELRDFAPLIGMLMMATSLDGSIARRFVMREHPDRPPWLSCAISWWRL